MKRIAYFSCDDSECSGGDTEVTITEDTDSDIPAVRISGLHVHMFNQKIELPSVYLTLKE